MNSITFKTIDVNIFDSRVGVDGWSIMIVSGIVAGERDCGALFLSDPFMSPPNAE